MNELLLVNKLMRAFPGSYLEPKWHTNPAGLVGCVGCNHSTSLLDHTNTPWHEQCRRLAKGH